MTKEYSDRVVKHVADLLEQNHSADPYDCRNVIPYLHQSKIDEDDYGFLDGAFMKQDVKDENDDWFSRCDPDGMKTKSYRDFIKEHQHAFRSDRIYPFTSDVDDEPKPLTRAHVINLIHALAD